MAKIDTNSYRRLKPKKRRMSNRTTVIVRVVAACLLFFACTLFFFENIDIFWDDLISFSPFPIIFFSGIIWIVAYIINLITKIENKDLHHADRFDWLYKLVFTIVVLAMVLRSFLFTLTVLSVTTFPEILISAPIIAIISGVITLLTPRIIDNANEDF